MGKKTTNFPGKGNNDNFQVPDSTGGQQVPDTLPQPMPMPEPEEKPEPGRPEPVPGQLGFSLR